jgi:CDP-glucose 4,6-dehydratase
MFENTYKNHSVLITGDTGFKGSWLTAWLLELGAEVTGFALPPRSARENFVRAGLAGKMTHIEGDIRDIRHVRKVVEQCKPEVVFHLAAQPLVLESYNSPRDTFETNVMGTVNLLEAARLESCVKAFVNVTSDKCYSNKEWMWGYRENDPLGGKDPYSASKACSEIVTAAFQHSFFSGPDSMALASARAGNVIGGGDWGAFRLVPDCIRSLQNSETIVLRNPEATRPWQYVLEAIGGYLHLGSLLLTKGSRFAQAWNFGPGLSAMRTVKDVVETLLRYWGKGTYSVDQSPPKLHEAHFLYLDISKSVCELGWKPRLSFEQAVELTVDGYRRMADTKSDGFKIMAEAIETYDSFIK